MPTRKISDIPIPDLKPCYDPDHDPPKYMVFKPGVYEHVCPRCGKTIRFVVGRMDLMADTNTDTPRSWGGWGAQ